MKDPIRNDEVLYRNVIMNPDFWKKKNGRPSSAVFKDSNGVSVDRDGAREEAVIVERFKSRFEGNVKAVVSVNAGYCREISTHLLPSPTSDNPYHAEIHDSTTEKRLRSGKAKKLSKICNIVYME